MPDIQNERQLYATFSPIVEKAVNYVMDKMLEEYKNLIDDIVYHQEFPAVYHRTEEFLNSWKTEVSTKMVGATGELSQDYKTMSFNPETFTHGSNYYEPNDVRPFLANIIYEGLSGDLFGAGWWQESRDAWTPLIQQLDGGKLDKWFKEGMKKQGIQIIKI